MGVVLYAWGHVYLVAAFEIIVALLIGVKSMEIIQLSRPEQRQLVGRRRLVLNEVEKGKGGVVRVYDRKARLDPELWSAESEYSISAGQEAEVVGIRTVVLIKPTQPVRPNGTSEFSET
jgi:membrane protein implicated in regulation of membrane protease activity